MSYIFIKVELLLVNIQKAQPLSAALQTENIVRQKIYCYSNEACEKYQIA